MIDLTRDIHPLTDFKRKTAEFMKRLKRTGHPLVLTVNGKAELVVHDAKSYQKLLDAIERAEAVQGIGRGLESIQEDKGIPLEKADEKLRSRHGIPH